MYALDASARDKISSAWETQFARLFELLGAADTRQYVDAFIHPAAVAPQAEAYIGRESAHAMADDLQD
jgi:hypothetical protein